MPKCPVPMRLNSYGSMVPDWNHWSVRLRLWLYYEVAEPFLPLKIWFWLYRADYLLDGEPEDCWCGGWELGSDD